MLSRKSQGFRSAARKSPAVALALDDTDFQAHPKDMNGAYGYVQIGQQMLWKRGLIFPAFYDLTHMQFLGCHQQDYRDSLAKNKSMLPLILEIQRKTAVIRADWFIHRSS